MGEGAVWVGVGLAELSSAGSRASCWAAQPNTGFLDSVLPKEPCVALRNYFPYLCMGTKSSSPKEPPEAA